MIQVLPETTTEKVIQLAKMINADIDVKVICVAHRLLNKKGVTRAIIVKVARGVANIDTLKRKRVLGQSKQSSQVERRHHCTSSSIPFTDGKRHPSILCFYTIRNNLSHYAQR